MPSSLGVAAAEDMTQRHPSPWFARATSTSAQSAYPLADYAIKELKYKKIVTVADDFAYGHEMCAGFQRAFEDGSGKIIQERGGTWSDVTFDPARTQTWRISDKLTGVRGAGRHAPDGSNARAFTYEATVNHRNGNIERVSMWKTKTITT